MANRYSVIDATTKKVLEGVPSVMLRRAYERYKTPRWASINYKFGGNVWGLLRGAKEREIAKLKGDDVRQVEIIPEAPSGP